MALLIAILTAGFFAALGLWPRTPNRDDRAGPRAVGSDVSSRLAEFTELLEKLPAMEEPARERVAASFVVFLRCDVRFQLAARAEEVYSVVDASVGGRHAFTSSFRETHRLMNERIDGLAALAEARPLEAARFSREGIALLGILEAHLEVEESVLMPLYNRALTPAETRARLGVSKSLLEGFSHIGIGAVTR